MVDSKIVELLHNIITLTETLPLNLLGEKRKNPHGMQLLQDTLHVDVNSHKLTCEPWVSIAEISSRVVAGRITT